MKTVYLLVTDSLSRVQDGAWATISESEYAKLMLARGYSASYVKHTISVDRTVFNRLTNKNNVIQLIK